MNTLLFIYVLLPLVAMLILLFVHKKSEALIEKIVMLKGLLTMGIWMALSAMFFLSGESYFESSDIVIYDSSHYHFTLSFLFDWYSSAYLGLSSVLSFMIIKYSCQYLHMEEGYKRFFVTIMAFLFSIDIISLSGNFETLFFGWEILGVSSFLLIAYYRDRYLPVRNGLKVFTYYRLADAGLLLTMWISHHVWHQNVKFSLFLDQNLVHDQIGEHQAAFFAMALLIGLAAAVKSAQFPFSSWLARAMEGPTPSSAIFYGSIAVNIGCFLMLRTYPLWNQVLAFKVFAIIACVITIFLANNTAKVQSNVKAQIAYSSITQIAIIFIEIILGLHTIAIIHLVGNAFLRAYQLLISPSIVTYLMREQFFNYQPRESKGLLSSKWRNTLLIGGIKEWRIDSIMYNYVWNPLKKMGKITKGISASTIALVSLVLLSGALFLINNEDIMTESMHHWVSIIACTVSLFIALKGFTDRGNPVAIWSALIIAHFWLVIGVGLNEHFNAEDAVFYLSGIILSAIAGYFILFRLQKTENLNVDGYYGLAQRYPILSAAFLLVCITMAGFPLSTTFIGEDLLFTHIELNQFVLAILVTLIYIIEGIALLRMYTRLFLGPYQANERYTAKRFA